MASIYFPINLNYTDEESQTLFKLRGRIFQYYDYVNPIYDVGEKGPTDFQYLIGEADLTIVYIGTQTITIDATTVSFIGNFTAEQSKLFIPVFDPELDKEIIAPFLLDQFMEQSGLILNGRDEDSINRLFDKIEEIIVEFDSVQKNRRQLANREQIKQEIREISGTYITTAQSTLDNRRFNLWISAIIAFVTAYIFLFVGIWFVISTSKETLAVFQVKSFDWHIILYLSIKNILIVFSVVTASTYSFKLGRAFMAEQLKMVDRSHAISYGRFFLDIFQNNVSKDEFKEAFIDWNMNTSTSAFSDPIPIRSKRKTEKVIEKEKSILDRTKEIASATTEIAKNAMDVVKEVKA